MTAEEILSIHTDTFNRALKEQDYAALEDLYASDYMLVRPDGSVLNKQECCKTCGAVVCGFIRSNLVRQRCGCTGQPLC